MTTNNAQPALEILRDMSGCAVEPQNGQRHSGAIGTTMIGW